MIELNKYPRYLLKSLDFYSTPMGSLGKLELKPMIQFIKLIRTRGVMRSIFENRIVIGSPIHAEIHFRANY